jgi:serine/threonine protein phosphatase 1
MPPAELTFAVGDTHGCREMLDRLLERCFRYAGERPARLVFLGDYIDRGPDSRGVVETLIGLQRRLPDRVVCLRGNHEVLLLEALANDDMRLWLFNGADTTLASYGVDQVSALPPDHLAWYAALKPSFDDGRRFFVHAGVDPDRPLDQQRDYDLAWIREPFLSRVHDYGRLIVHGHTPQRTGKPDLRPWRLNLDTAAVYGGRLTAAVFDDRQVAPLAFLTDTSDAQPALPLRG